MLVANEEVCAICMQHLCCPPDSACPANTISTALVVVCQSELLMVSADPAVPAAESDQWLVFEVTDTGCGISRRGLASLFTEYVQVSVVRNLSVAQLCFLCCCIRRNASSLMLASASFCSMHVHF